MAKMPMSIRAIVVAALSCSLIGCGGGPTSGPKQSTVTIGDRIVSAFLDVPGEIQKDGESAIVTSGILKVQIEKERVVIDGNDSGAIPAAARRVDVVIVDNVLTVTADDAFVASKPIKSKEIK